MPETRSGKAIPNDTKELDIVSIIEEKINKFKVDLLSEIKDLIYLEKINKFKVDLLSEIKDLISLEVEKVMKKQKENFEPALHEFRSVLLKWSMTMMIWSNMDVVCVCV